MECDLILYDIFHSNFISFTNDNKASAVADFQPLQALQSELIYLNAFTSYFDFLHLVEK